MIKMWLNASRCCDVVTINKREWKKICELTHATRTNAFTYSHTQTPYTRAHIMICLQAHQIHTEKTLTRVFLIFFVGVSLPASLSVSPTWFVLFWYSSVLFHFITGWQCETRIIKHNRLKENYETRRTYCSISNWPRDCRKGNDKNQKSGEEKEMESVNRIITYQMAIPKAQIDAFRIQCCSLSLLLQNLNSLYHVIPCHCFFFFKSLNDLKFTPRHQEINSTLNFNNENENRIRSIRIRIHTHTHRRQRNTTINSNKFVA